MADLEEELDKLKIGQLPQIKLVDQNIEINPFYDEAITESPPNKIFGGSQNNKCNCRVRRRSESVLDDYKTTSNLSLRNQNERTIRNCNQFKKTANGKIVLREPILKAFQQCLHPHSLATKKLSSGDKNTVDTNCSTIEALNLDESSEIARKLNEATKLTSVYENENNVTDFRQLVEECQTLLETNVSFSNEWRNNHSRKNSKTFNSMPLPNSISRHDTINTNSSESSSSATSTAHKPRGDQLSRSTTTTCSQQARINTNNATEPMQQPSSASSSSCDVTIDELASYFETLVHIPKKMSTMAEMMYI